MKEVKATPPTNAEKPDLMLALIVFSGKSIKS